MTYELHHGDCLDVLRTLPDASVDAVVTDPPYSSGGAMRGDRMQGTRQKYCQSSSGHYAPEFHGDNRDQRGYLAWCRLWMAECLRIAKNGALGCFFTDWRQLPTTTDAVQAAGWVWRGIAVWVKNSSRPTQGRYAAQSEFIVWGTKGPRPIEGECARGAWMTGTPTGDERVHITQKPVELMDGLMKPLPVGGVVLDPFMGSGSTGVSAVKHGLDFIGCEMDEDFLQVARGRIERAIASRGVFI